jgi:sulfite reductase alpha subunit-like flavoprotein
MTRMWNLLLRSDLPSDLLEGTDYAVFGLGDTAYEKFCWAAKKLARRLESLGGREICPRGEGDEQHYLGYASSSCPSPILSFVQNRRRS